MGTVITSAGQAPQTTSWQVPAFECDPSHRLGWVEEQIQEGEGWLSGQSAYRNLVPNMRIYEGIFVDNTRSTLHTNFLKYNIRKFVETISDVREIALYGSDATQFKPYAEVENRVAKAVYLESQYPRQLRKALQYAAAMGVGYLWTKCRAEDYGRGERRIVFEPLGLLDVIPVQVPASNDVQDSYAVTVYEYMPVAEAHARFPLFQSQLKPVDQTRFNSRIEATRLNWQDRMKYGIGESSRNWGNLYCEIRYTFIRDMRINTTQFELPMGDEGTTWFHKVPYVGQPIFGGIRNGQAFMRPAAKEDCWVYPNLRLIITAKGVSTPMYDGPAFDWHGKIPVVQYLVDDVPWKPLGESLVENVGSIEQTKRKHERMMDQVLTTTMNPPLGYDRTATGGPKVENFDIFEQNIRAGVDGQPRQILQSLLPEEVRVTEENRVFLESLTKMEEMQLGINDIGSLVNLKMNVTSDSFDKVLESVGPIAKGIATSMEEGNAKIGYMLKFMIPQWFDTSRIIQYIGPNSIPPEIFDFDPNSLIPSHGLEEYVRSEDGLAKPPLTESVYDKMQRAKCFARNLRLISVPSTLLKITQMQEQLKYLQLYRGQFPISPQTVAKKLGIDNYGDIDGDTEFEKWMNWMKLKIMLESQAQQLAAELMPAGTGTPENIQTAPHPGGRPPTGQRAPRLVQKGKTDGKPRTTITEAR